MNDIPGSPGAPGPGLPPAAGAAVAGPAVAGPAVAGPAGTAADEGTLGLAADEGTLGLAADDGTLGLAAELLATASAIRRIARRAARRAWQDEPLPPAQSELLRLAAAQPGLSVADAARELRLAPNTVSTLVGRLTAAGLLERARASSDGRSVRLSVTGPARQRIEGWRDLRAELGARALAELPPGDLDTLAATLPALRRFAAQLGELP